MQKNGAGVHSANALWVDPSNDGIVTVKWPTDKKGDGNRTMYCIVNVLALNFSFVGPVEVGEKTKNKNV